MSDRELLDALLKRVQETSGPHNVRFEAYMDGRIPVVLVISQDNESLWIKHSVSRAQAEEWARR